jgi:hypothetical protein
VHRFGIDSLPIIDAASPEAEAESINQLQPGSVLNTTAFSEELVNPEDLGVSLDLVAQEFVPPIDRNDSPTLLGINQISEQLAHHEATTVSQDLMVQDSLPEEEITDTAVGQEFEETPLEPLGDRNIVVSISAPPISTPRSLRRWLPRADQTFLQAS